MSQFKTDEIKPCRCGFKPDHYSIYYGRTPYDIFCPNCQKQTTLAKCKVTGHHENVIDYWNNHIRYLTKGEIDKEVLDLKRERQEKDPDYEYSTYDYYWEKGKGEVLYASVRAYG